MKRFRLARMSPLIRALTLALLALPLLLLTGAFVEGLRLCVPALSLMAIYAWIWLRFRPSRFVVRSGTLEVVWPLKRRAIPRGDIADVRPIGKTELRRELGLALRVGAGGLWGGFGWLWTQKRGIVQMVVSRTDGLVWIERRSGRPWLITPEDPEGFVRALSPCTPS